VLCFQDCTLERPISCLWPHEEDEEKQKQHTTRHAVSVMIQKTAARRMIDSAADVWSCRPLVYIARLSLAGHTIDLCKRLNAEFTLTGSTQTYRVLQKVSHCQIINKSCSNLAM